MRWIYERDDKNLNRYALGQVFDESGRTLICFGINPSTASPEQLDNTINKVVKIARFNGYDNWIMLNIYPQRATNPDDLHLQADEQIVKQNIEAISQILDTYSDCDTLFAYGNLITKRSYLRPCLEQISKLLKLKNKTIKVIKLTKEGNPVHPLYQRNNATLIDF
ncbi:MAG: DUF1643 domain-containing protein [Clostridia bacterium]|nr:DUF1643 domain-containing protein [Clostridia bacterium]MBQ9354107.1 DUF1643 domain-containing protein [Clostridia bacterium]